MSTTVFGSITDYQKGSIEIVSGDPKHYVFSNPLTALVDAAVAAA